MSVLPLSVSQVQPAARGPDANAASTLAKTTQINLPVPARGGTGPIDRASSPTRNQPTGPLAAPEAAGGVQETLPSRASVETVIYALSERQDESAREDRARQEAESGYQSQADAVAPPAEMAEGQGSAAEPVGLDRVA